MSKSLAYFQYLMPGQLRCLISGFPFRFLKSLLGFGVAAAGLVLSHPYFFGEVNAWLPPICQLLALYVLFYFSKNLNKKIAAVYWTLCFFFTYAIFLRWIGQSPYLAPWGNLGQYLAAAILSLGIGVWSRLSFLFDREKVLHRLAICGLWGLIEWSRQYWFCGFPWYTLSLSWIDTSIGSLLLGLLGPFFTSSLILFTAMELSLPSPKKILKPLTILLVLWSISAALASVTSKEYRLPVEVAALHTDMPLHYFPGCYERLEVWERFLEKRPTWNESSKNDSVEPLTRFCLTHEGLLPGGLELQQEFLSNPWLASKLAKLWQTHLIIGLEDDGLDLGVANAVGIWSPDGKLLGYYHKQILVPFAEYFPLLDWPLIGPWFAELSRSYGILEPVIAGKRSGRYILGGVDTLLSICFEETFPSSVAYESRKGARIWMSSSNDGWFPATVLPFDHFLHARLVSASTGLPLVRSTQQGYSACINGFGHPVGSVLGPKSSWDWLLVNELCGRRTIYGAVNEIYFLAGWFSFVCIMAFSSLTSVLRRKGGQS